MKNIFIIITYRYLLLFTYLLITCFTVTCYLFTKDVFFRNYLNINHETQIRLLFKYIYFQMLFNSENSEIFKIRNQPESSRLTFSHGNMAITL